MCIWKGELLFSEMLKRGWSATELAKAAGLSTVTVLKCLRRGARASIPTVSKIAKALNVRGELLVEWR